MIKNLFLAFKRFGFRAVRFLYLSKLNDANLLHKMVSIRFPGVRHPVFLRPRTSDFKLFRNIFIDREYDISLPFTPQTIIDGGGNIGLAAVLFANRYPEAKIVSIEPETSNFMMLQKNTGAYSNIKPVKAGIWRKSSYLHVSNPTSGKWAFIVEETAVAGDDTIRGISIDDLIRQNGWNNADLVKLDIEGSEKEVFEAQPELWLNKAKALIIELHDWIKPRCSNAVFDSLRPYNFKKSQKGENTVFIRSQLEGA